MTVDAFTLVLLDARERRDIADVRSLVAADASGQFGIHAGHAALVTVLEPGLFRWRCGAPEAGDATDAAGGWTYAACLGGLLHCERGPGTSRVTIVSSRFVQDDDLQALQRRLDALLDREGDLRVSARESAAALDTALVRRLQQLSEGPRP